VTWVLKIGGSVRDPDAILCAVAERDERVVIVHGGSRELDQLSARCGATPRMVASERGEVSRYTDAATMDLFLMAYAGKTNKRIVERLRQLGRNAIGLCGLDGGVVQGRRRADLRIRESGRVKVLHDNHVGSIERVDVGLLCTLMDAGYTPVLCPPISAEDGTAINVDGDKLAAEVAIALRAERLFIFADTPGLLRDVDDERSLIGRVTQDEAPALLESIGGRARVKLRAAADARRRGVAGVVLADGRCDTPLAAALGGAGTWLA
jgi:[amino group carrier protein]-L-2-aminoadipate/L-glutamate 6-kinase